MDTLACYEDFNTRSGFVDVAIRGIRVPIQLRRGTSDFLVFRQIFARQQYALQMSHSIRFIVDAGANIGLASIFFLRRYPNARVLAIEPDPENYAIAEHNLAQFGDRCHLVNAALWPTECNLAIHRGEFRDGKHWATQTRPVSDGETETVRARTLVSLLSEYGFHRIDLLKMDIEGAERFVFGTGDVSFLQNTEFCAVECHDADCERAFVNAVSPYNFVLGTSGELVTAARQ